MSIEALPFESDLYVVPYVSSLFEGISKLIFERVLTKFSKAPLSVPVSLEWISACTLQAPQGVWETYGAVFELTLMLYGSLPLPAHEPVAVTDEDLQVLLGFLCVVVKAESTECRFNLKKRR